MMNKIWGTIIIISVAVGVYLGKGAELSSAVIDGASTAVNLIFTIGATICFWSGIMNIAKEAGITTWISKAFSPIIKKLFPDYADAPQVTGAICMNISANLLGLGNAATPFGIEAMKQMKKHSDISDTANGSMIKFVVLNTASIQLIPTTIAAMRQSAGSKMPMEILPYIWICSGAALIVGITAAKTLEKLTDMKKRSE